MLHWISTDLGDATYGFVNLYTFLQAYNTILVEFIAFVNGKVKSNDNLFYIGNGIIIDELKLIGNVSCCGREHNKQMVQSLFHNTDAILCV